MQQLSQLSGEDNQRGQNLSAAGASHQPNRQRRHNHQQQQQHGRRPGGGAAAPTAAGRDLGGTRIPRGGRRCRSGSWRHGSGSRSRSRSNRTWRTAEGYDGRLELVVLAAVPADGMGVRADCLRTNMIH